MWKIIIKCIIFKSIYKKVISKNVYFFLRKQLNFALLFIDTVGHSFTTQFLGDRSLPFIYKVFAGKMPTFKRFYLKFCFKIITSIRIYIIDIMQFSKVNVCYANNALIQCLICRVFKAISVQQYFNTSF